MVWVNGLLFVIMMINVFLVWQGFEFCGCGVVLCGVWGNNINNNNISDILMWYF